MLKKQYLFQTGWFYTYGYTSSACSNTDRIISIYGERLNLCLPLKDAVGNNHNGAVNQTSYGSYKSTCDNGELSAVWCAIWCAACGSNRRGPAVSVIVFPCVCFWSLIHNYLTGSACQLNSPVFTFYYRQSTTTNIRRCKLHSSLYKSCIHNWDWPMHSWQLGQHFLRDSRWLWSRFKPVFL